MAGLYQQFFKLATIGDGAAATQRLLCEYSKNWQAFRGRIFLDLCLAIMKD
jgi:hypothetical protein